MKKTVEDIPAKKIYLSRSHYITIASLVAILLWVVGATYLVLKYVQLDPLKEARDNLKQELDTASTKNQILTTKLASLEKSYKNILEDTNRPILLSPADGASVIGDRITFEWDYERHTPRQKYILEIRNISVPGSKVLRYNVYDSEQKRMHHRVPRSTHGEFIWRIQPGYLFEEKEFSQGPMSQYQTFVLYPSVIDRIKITKILMVGTSPTVAGYFSTFDGQGGIEGFDVRLIRWIAKQLDKKLNLDKPLKVEIFDVPWTQLLPKLQQYELDTVISGMTSTQPREEKFRGIKFTEGYYQSHQIFVQRKITPNESGSFPKGLSGKIVGATFDTTNETAAIYLKGKFDFQVDSSYNNYAGVFQALVNKTIDFGLVDEILVGEELKAGFEQYGPKLDSHLIEFYRKKFSRESEKYAIAVVDEQSQKQNLLHLINEILSSDEGRNILKNLEECWITAETEKKGQHC